jgi:hypothetical protein
MVTMKMRFVLPAMLLLAACSLEHMPAKWRELGISEEGLVRVEDETDENGLYLEYRGRSREELTASVWHALTTSGYTRSHSALDGNALGFEKDDDRLVVKIDRVEDRLYLAIFNEKGKDPLLHGVVFGKYTLGPPVAGEKANEALLEELEEQ